MSLTIDGKTLKELGLALLPEHEHPAAPSTRDYTVTIPGMSGAYDFGADLEARPFTLPLLVKPQSSYELAPKIREIMKTFFDPYGKPKTMKLTFDY
ncbi:phage tail protein, partial [Bacillus cereus]